MDRHLILTIKSYPTCEIYLEDSSDYTTFKDINNYFLVEYLEADKTIIDQRIIPITSKNDSFLKTSKPFVGINGLQNIGRLIVPSLEVYKVNSTYNVENKYFVLDNEVYFSETNFTSINKNDLILIEDYSSFLDTQQPEIYSGVASLFSYCTLKNCILERLKNEIQLFKKQGCDFNCAKKENYETNFLLESLYTIELLIDQNKISDAQRVLNTVMSCGALCENRKIENTDCGCGNS